MNLQQKADYIYNSNLLSGITISYDKTLRALRGDIEPGSEIDGADGTKYEVEIITNHLDAVNFVLSYPRSVPINLAALNELHKHLMDDMILSAGEFRECELEDLHGVPPLNYREIMLRLRDFFIMLKNELSEAKDKGEFARKTHNELLLIHPYVDGNARLARLFCNLIRVRHRLPFEVFYHDHREKYFKSVADYIRTRSDGE